MIKQYIRQAITLLKENKLLSIISIAGTALAIAMVMVVIIILQAKTADYEPEVNRSRTLYVKWGSAVSKISSNERNYNRLSLYDIQQAFYPLTTPEAITAVYNYGSMLSTVPGSDDELNCEVLYTDDAFWQVFEFGFLAGRPFSKAAFKAGLKQAVISESTARRLFGGVNEAIGRQLDINFVGFSVCGVVRDVSKFAEQSYAEIWLPYTSNSNLCSINISGWGEGHSGSFQCFMLARKRSDFPLIRSELAASIRKMNSVSREYKLDIMNQPDEFFVQMLHKFANTGNGGNLASRTVIRYCIILFIVLLVPAINLSGLTQSRMRRRIAELGVRKAFGANKVSLLMQVLSENLLLTLIGSLFGLLFAYLGLWTLSGWLLASDLGGEATMNVSMISPWIFLIALVFCLIFNLLSAGIPAWKAANTTIVNALNER
ncbi:ABC transporter permease [uncultured Bacteroides sp.]|uniref:ABC transporter permease n=1 Tax=uncultured Bacteroides sp. TaxID=162156 RepID=UPI002AA93895|nr:ABC transporter permease [uncultured Bacteroides sp.]